MSRYPIYKFFTILAGASLYIILCFMPAFGPLIVGAYIGGRIRNTRESILISFISAFLGFLILSFLLYPAVEGSIFLGMVYILWQAVSVMFMLLGSMFGSVLQGFENLIDLFNYQRVENSINKEKRRERDRTTFIICPVCGESNEEHRDNCKACGARI